MTPLQILDEWIRRKNYSEAKWSEDRKTVVINGEPFHLSEYLMYVNSSCTYLAICI